ncbi:dopamine D2-like receptor [Periophthalmus magnuspinnatus]|uniref:dopamine D2-like receptor n=1 Tax=Periophthalmus magnuspinnatus TaxID=409849 RepID=UPI00145A2F31|nr:dopamine D2-like receptor [Periophthalmus magnuspinnatus]
MIGAQLNTLDTKNKTSLETYLDLGFVAANTLILLATFFVGIAANVFVILAVYKQKSLQTSNNALVVNLAVIDFLRCVIDCPVLLTIVSMLNQKGHVETIICDMQVVSFSFSCCIQLLTLACISVERYQAISQPFKIAQRRKRIMVWIPLTWIVAIVVALFCLLFLKDSPVYVRCQGFGKGTLQISYDTYGLYMVLPLWAACFSIIIGFYTRIFVLVRSYNRKIFDKGITPVEKNNKEETKKKELNTIQMEPMGTEAAQKSPNKDTVSALLTSNLPQCISPGAGNEKENALEVIELEQPYKKAIQDGGKVCESEKPKTTGTDGDARDGVKSSNSNLQQMSNNLNSENSKEKAQNDTLRENNRDIQSAAQTTNQEPVSDVKMKASDNATVDAVSPVTKTEVEDPAQNIEGAVCMMPSKANRERANKKKESKMAKRAGYIIVTFLLFWLPIITTIILNFALHGNKYIQIAVIHDLELLSVSVACVTSLSNPIIYAAVNPQFRAEFYRLRNKLKSMYHTES